MKLAEAVGKTVVAVVHAAGSVDSGRKAVFLVFDDGTHVELWGSDFNFSGTRDGGVDDVVRYAHQMKFERVSAHPADRSVSDATEAR